MIPLVRRTTTASRNHSSTLKISSQTPACARQALPRPARLYSSPSRRVASPALATNSATKLDYAAYDSVHPPPPPHPPFAPSPLEHAKGQPSSESAKPVNSLRQFFDRPTSYTILPAPLPHYAHSTVNDYYYGDTPTQEQVSIIDACLQGLHDVHRAKAVFDQLRASRSGDQALSAGVYNRVLNAYIEKAIHVSEMVESETDWVAEARTLYQSMEDGAEKVGPTARTYANMLLLWLRLQDGTRLRDPVDVVCSYDPPTLLRCIIERDISVTQVVSDTVFESDEDAIKAIQVLSKTAVDMNLSKVVLELATAKELGSRLADPLQDIPDVVPVTKPVKEATQDATTDAQSDTVPQVEVPFNLSTLRKHLAQVAFARRVLPEDALARQKLLEETVYDVAVERLRHQSALFDELGLGNKGFSGSDLQSWMWNWHQKLQVRIKAEIIEVIKEEQRLPEHRRQNMLGPYLMLIKPDKLSLITILELMHLHGSGGVAEGMKTARALLQVGKAVETEYKAQVCRKHNIQVPAPASPTRSGAGWFSKLGYSSLHARRIAARQYMEDSEEWTSDWTQVVRLRMGSFLVDALMDVATVTRSAIDRRTGETVTEEQPAFYHAYEYVRGHKLGIIKLNTVVSERIARESLRETLHPRHLPMLVPPKPWTSYDQGGYLYNKTHIMRYKDSQEQLSYLREASKTDKLELIYAGLDVLGSTPWQINKPIFDVVLQVWNSGKRFLKIPPSVPEENEPEKPENYDTDPKARAVFIARHKAYLANKANNHSDRCSINYRIEIARTFLGDIFHFPHNVDFRGRAYPIPPHLNQLGDDLTRGLLKFGEGKPLTERGFRWMKIHLANLFGYDKGTFDERVKFVDEHLEDIVDSAERPLEGKGWWQKADDPWQCLATCMELKGAIDSGDPASFVSALPIHQDGTCNGLQHYAALGGDDRGARQVNLDVTDRPSDVYTHVAEMVEESIKKDLEKGDKYAQLLTGKIARKVVKQTVMTTVYGVTFIGAREQIERRLLERDDIPAEEAWFAASYLAKKLLDCIGDLFSGAKGIQTWLNTAARLITRSIPPQRIHAISSEVNDSLEESSEAQEQSGRDKLKKEQMSSVIWTTPLGLPIVQPYRLAKRKQIMTALQTIYISDPSTPASVNAQKQASAFPPNFIHSLDATHMMLTAIECKEQGIEFASVHDSYWTHASTVDEMSILIRDTFIALHSSDILGKLEQEFCERYKDHKIAVSALSKDQQAKFISAGTRISRGRKIKGQDDKEVAPIDESPHDNSDRVVGRTAFVNLVDILPPLPKKGHFDVKTIKKSLYFFS